METFFITFSVLVLLILLICIYFWPYFIATKKQEDEHLAIFIVNLFVAWTVIGWFICLMWAISLNDYRSDEQKEANKDAKNAIWSFIKKHWIPFLVLIVIISTFAGIGNEFSKNSDSNNSQNDNTMQEAIERYKKETKDFTNCQLGDLLGDDVETINYKGYRIDYHKSDFSKKQVENFAKECINIGAKTQYQLDCCVNFKMYPY